MLPTAMTDLTRPISDLEVARFTSELFDALGLSTLRDLTEVTEHRFLAEAEALYARHPGPPDQAPRKSLHEVNTLLADLGLRLKPEIPGGSYPALLRRVHVAADIEAWSATDELLRGQPAIRVARPPGSVLIGPDHTGQGVSFQWQLDWSHPDAEAFRSAFAALYRRVVEG
jgi:hypothetical protein